MRYLALIYTDETVVWSDEEQQEVMKAYYAFGDEGRKAGVLGDAGEALQPTSTATTVRVRDGETLTTDGPFAETKEQLGGFYLFSCDNLDQAIEWAAKIPGAKHGSIEVRPIMEFPEQ
ncbi:MAG: YciI family protein [Actinomycetota bacterium]